MTSRAARGAACPSPSASGRERWGGIPGRRPPARPRSLLPASVLARAPEVPSVPGCRKLLAHPGAGSASRLRQLPGRPARGPVPPPLWGGRAPSSCQAAAARAGHTSEPASAPLSVMSATRRPRRRRPGLAVPADRPPVTAACMRGRGRAAGVLPTASPGPASWSPCWRRPSPSNKKPVAPLVPAASPARSRRSLPVARRLAGIRGAPASPNLFFLLNDSRALIAICLHYGS